MWKFWRRAEPAEVRPAREAGGEPDVLLSAVIVTLIAFGIVMVFSASAVFALQRYEDPFRFLIRQAAFAGVGLILMFSLSHIDYRRLRALTYPAMATAVVLLLAVLFGLGRSAGGAARWIQVGPVNIQPAELAKLVMILWMAYSLSKKSTMMRSFQIGMLPHVLVAGFLMLLCLKQPDFGSAVMIGLLTFVLLFAAGARFGYLLMGLFLTLPAVYFLIALSPYRMRRIEAFLEPFEHRYGIGYQIAESLMSFGAGGVTGVGIGDSRQKLFYLPEAHTDFISAIVGEELGFVGVLLLIGLFGLLVWRGFRTAWFAVDEYGMYLALGITFFVGAQAFTNLAVAMGMVPTKGLVLPFMSYGGSSLLVNCAAIGILLSISRYQAARSRWVTPQMEAPPAMETAAAAPPRNGFLVRSFRALASKPNASAAMANGRGNVGADKPPVKNARRGGVQ